MAVQAAVVVAAIAGTLFLVNRQIEPDPGNGASLEAQWDSAIQRLGIGIEPVYPPQEDIAVGDVFVIVVDDAKAPIGTASKRPFLGKSVKLGHAKVEGKLDEVYNDMPLFPEIGSPKAQGASAPPAAEATSAFFGAHAQRTALPRAAFPGLTITNDGNAATAVASSRGWFDFGASRAASQKLVLGEVETYGLDAVDADNALESFCSTPDRKETCTEAAAREYLRMLLGDSVFDKHFDLNSNSDQFDLKIQVIMVSRIYMAREILEKWSSLVSEGGAAEATLAAAAKGLKPAEPSKSADATGPGEPIEKGLNGAQGGAVVYRSSAGTDILLDQKFPRPIAVGYRSVAHRFAPAEDAAR